METEQQQQLEIEQQLELEQAIKASATGDPEVFGDWKTASGDTAGRPSRKQHMKNKNVVEESVAEDGAAT